MIEAAADWEPAFAEWLKPFLEALGHKTRQRWAPVYVRGLLGPGERKSVQPMAARVAPADCDQLHHFISSPAWQTAPLAAVLTREADRLVGGPEAVLIIDDTALPKKGEHSVGVARQYAGVLGKTANSDVRRQPVWAWTCSLRGNREGAPCMSVAQRRRQSR
jgi:SRSO17 transposase